MTPDQAEGIALKMLGWLVGNEELLPIFMGATGADQDTLRENAGDPQFLAAMLDFLMMDDQWVMQACDAQGLPYVQVASVRQALPGGADFHWT
ncbi:DUF3572 domain-containing protein [Aliiroseovarius sp. F20344]|uniref:DUF3572 domain-containing protein n=1 Tax=Aliiroseovarius sp. F20344 TaxID=2926414 RepID=UPI001FF24F5B|nr:DUF3572 domain-containing protein [Aliiroseovarius sp. F20344]MCK0142475.1 DUF3572 domain-containing protein [Aliiroseovarius sp. F20344]